MDLSSITDIADAEFEIVHPVTRKGTGNFFTLLGPQHPLRKKSYAEIGADVVSRLQGATAQEVAEEKDLQFLAGCVASWRYQNPDKGMEADRGSFIRWDGGNLVHTPPAVREILGNPKYKWLAEQVDAYLGKRDRFIKDSSPSSAAGSSGVSASAAPSPATASTPAGDASLSQPSASPA